MTHWRVRLCMVLRYLEFVWYWCACASQRIQATLTRSNPRVQLQSAGWIFRMKFVLLLKISWSVSAGMSPLNICFGGYVFPSRSVLKNDSKVRTDCETARRRGGSGRRWGRETSRDLGRSWKDITLKTPNVFNGGFNSNHLLYVASIPTQQNIWKEKVLELLVACFFNVEIWFQVKYFMGFLPEGDEGLAEGGWWIWKQENLG